jgi:phage gp29-like protein
MARQPGSLRPLARDPFPSDEDEKSKVVKVARELPINLTVELDRVEQVKNAIRMLDQGLLRDASLLVDQMMKDDRIYGDLNTLTSGILSSPVHCEPAREMRAAKKIAEALESQWDMMYPTDQLADLVRWGTMIGIGIAENIFDVANDGLIASSELRPRLKTWHPQFAFYQWSTESYWLNTADQGLIELPKTDENLYSDGHWVVFTPYGYKHGFRRAMVRALAQPWLIRQWTYRDWARYSEVHGLPIRKAFTPAQADLQKRKKFIRDVANLGAEAAIECPTNADGQKFDIGLEEAKGDSVDAFDKLIGRCEKSISICILGQDSSDRAQGGSLAQAKENIRIDHLLSLSESLAETLQHQSVSWWAKHNLVGGERLCPLVSFDVAPPEDELAEASALSAVAQALSTFALSGAPVDVRAILDAHGIPTIAEASEPMPNAPLPSAPEVALREVALAEREVARPKYGATRAAKYGSRRPLDYQERLAMKAREAASRALRPDLAAVLSDIKGAKNFAELKKKLAERYRNLDPKAFAQLMKRSLVLAQLAGRHDVLAEVIK